MLLILCTSDRVFAQLKVGNNPTSIKSSAIFEVESQNKGALLPRIALASNTDQQTISSPVEGLMVYNLGTGGLSYKGYVFWNGTQWRGLDNSNLAAGTIGAISCDGASMSPNTYAAGLPYMGTLSIPYTGGDGGMYPAQTLGPINGLTATLEASNFSNGNGSLSYKLSGTPTVSSPLTTTFTVSVGGQTCSVIVGQGISLGQGQLSFTSKVLSATSTGWLSDYVSQLPVLGGKIRVDAWFSASSNGGNGSVTMYPRLVNITGGPVKIWFSSVSSVNNFNASNYVMASQGYLELDNGIYYGYGYNDIGGTGRASGSGEGGHQEVLTADVSLDGAWYRVYYFPIVDNLNTADAGDNIRRINLAIQRLY